jgi:hypothetical protein
MAAINLFYTDTLTPDSLWPELSETAVGAATSATGWIVGTGATLHSEMAAGVKRASTTFVNTNPPDGSLDATLKDALRSENPYNGDFASANWVLHFVIRAVTSATGQLGRIRFRLFKANADGTGATEITSAQQLAAIITPAASTTVDSDSTLTFNPGAFNIANQYLFLQIAWERTTGASMTTADILFRTGSSVSVGTRITTASFTQSTTQIDIVGAASGAAAPSGNLVDRIPIVGASSGLGTPLGDITDRVQIVGSTSGLGSLAGVVVNKGGLIGASAGVGLTIGNLDDLVGIQGSVSSVASVTGSLGDITSLSGSVIGLATLIGIITDRIPIQGSAAGVGTPSAALAQRIALIGAALGLGVTAGAFDLGGLIGSAFGVGSAQGSIIALRPLEGAVQGSGIIQGHIDRIQELSGSILGVGSIQGNVDRIIGLIGQALGVGILSGDITNIRAIVIDIPPCPTTVILAPSLNEVLLNPSVIGSIIEFSVNGVDIICLTAAEEQELANG